MVEQKKDTHATDVTESLHGKKILVLGAGREGQGTAQFLAEKYQDAAITIADQEKIKFSYPGVENVFGKKYPESLEEWDIVIVSPGIPPSTPLLKTAKKITNATALFLKECNGTVIMVTGSKGKSTTSALIHQMLIEDEKPAHLVGNIGVSSLAMLLEHNTVEDLYVVETSSYQARLLTHGPGIAVITQLFPEHLDYHGSVEQYYEDKMRVTTTQTADQTVVYFNGSEEIRRRIGRVQAKKIAVPSQVIDKGAQELDGVLVYDNEPIIDRAECRLQGQHNTNNILLAITVAKMLRVENEYIAKALKSFSPLPHRLEQVGSYKGVTFYNDSLSTTPEATLAALQAIDNVQTIFLGGQDRGYDFTELIAELKQRHIMNFVLFPDSGKTIREQWGEVEYGTQFFETESMRDAVEFAYKHTGSGGVALLSCASPSYSIFENFEDRGEQFRAAVEELGVE